MLQLAKTILERARTRQRLVPAPIELARHQPVLGVGGVVLAEAPLGLGLAAIFTPEPFAR